MNRLLAVVVLALIAPSMLIADITMERARFLGNVEIDAVTGNQRNAPMLVSGLTTIYNNVGSTVAAGFSSNDLNATWGDAVNVIDVGYWDGVTVPIFNSGTGNTFPISTCTLTVRMYDALTYNPTGSNTPLKAFQSNLNMVAFFGGSGLPAGFFATFAFGNLKNLFNTPTSDILGPIVITTQLSNITGGSLRTGTILNSADIVGSQYTGGAWSGAAQTYRNVATGFANAGTGLVNVSTNRLLLQVTAVPEPGSFVVLGALSLLGIAVRRRSK